MHSFADHLASLPLFNVTNAMLPGAGEPLPFLALRRDAMGVVVPSDDESRLLLAPPTGERSTHVVTCLLPWGTVTGELELLANVRVSDYLLHQQGFICLRNAQPAGGGELLPLVLINARSLVGVSEGGPPELILERPGFTQAPRSAPGR
jgi:hypothetical protein